ncbi:hypothetical protein FOA52_015656 [Chlamydomonas sp. UWO 241]|nr:hypothetical protein FOA52_015656 [Chlamydomonas sp. UWO 241]
MELPRLLDIGKLVDARTPELETLMRQVEACRPDGSFGAPAMARHLRRRATSHNRYITRRRPNIKLAAALQQAQLAQQQQQGEPAGEHLGRPTNRAMQRRPERYAARAGPPHGWLPTTTASAVAAAAAATAGTAEDAPSSNEPASSSYAGRPWRLETHAWHARRFKMEPRWGVLLAVAPFGRCRGSRSALHHARRGALVHDASYWSCLRLGGTREQLEAMLRAVSDPGLLSRALSRSDVSRGASEFGLMLHAPGQFPRGALCPARALFVPPATPCGPSDGGSSGGGSGSADDGGGDEDGGGTSSGGALWMWVHAAGAADAARALACAAASVGASPPLPLPLRRLELLGPRAEAALAAVLRPAGAGGPGGSGGGRMWAGVCAQRRGEGVGGAPRREWAWPVDAVVGVRAVDPRVAAPVRLGLLGVSVARQPREAEPLPAWSLGRLQAAWPRAGDWASDVAELLALGGGGGGGGPGSGGGACEGPAAGVVARPVGGQRVGEARRAARAAAAAPDRDVSMLSERGSDGGGSSEDDHDGDSDDAMEEDASGGGGTGRSSSGGGASGSGSGRGATVPLLLVHRRHGGSCGARGGLPGWSVVLPAGWVGPLWGALTYTGARAATQLEWHWSASGAAAAPCFPYDFPHTPAGRAWATETRARHAAAAARRPAGRARRVAAGAYVPWGGSSGDCGGGTGGGASGVGWKGGLLPRPRGGRHDGALPAAADGVVMQRGRDEEGEPPVVWASVAAGRGACWEALTPGSSQADAGPGQQQQQQQQPRETRVQAKCRTHLERALRRAAADAGASTPLPLRDDPAPAPAPAPASSVTATTSSGGPRHLVYARVQVVGRGRCEEGAAVVVCSTCGASAPATATGSTAARPRAPAAHAEDVVIGFVTSAAPRGSGGGAYPGGLALCDAQLLAGVAAAQQAAQGGAGECGSAPRGGSRPLPAACALRCWVRNPGSDALRGAALRVLTSGSVHACGASDLGAM